MDYHAGQWKVEGILSDDVLVAGHLKGRLDNAPDAGDGTVSPTVPLQLHKPQLGVRGTDGVDHTIAEILFFCKVQHEVVADFGHMADTLL